ncbi:hypothetical protein VCR15J2_470500 [Vibrio coralliirubri]|uniref:Ig-like domain-containing protein n=1 Tax=Vibrio coralliirubri TaxID=1516159 RepID=UPI00063A5C1C|nr:Ig-like domain-containing protein [Vibrio coralliirubri]CDT67609.1 hypothetical protein VCR15J2_470500 [Vibrio coralliirubri]
MNVGLFRFFLVMWVMLLAGCNGEGGHPVNNNPLVANQSRNIIINSDQNVVSINKSLLGNEDSQIEVELIDSSQGDNFDITSLDIVVKRTSPLEQVVLSYRVYDDDSQGNGLIVISPKNNFSSSHSLPPISAMMIASSSLDIDINQQLGSDFPSGAILTSFSSRGGSLTKVNTSTLNYLADNPLFVGTDIITYTLEVQSVGGGTNTYIGFIDLAISDPVTDAPTSTDFKIIPPLTVKQSHTVNVAPYVADANNDTLRLVSVKTYSPELTISSLKGLSFNVTPNKFGHYQIAYTVTDDRGGYTSSHITFTVGTSIPNANNFNVVLDSNPVAKQFTIDTSSAISNPGGTDKTALVITGAEILGDNKGLIVSLDPNAPHNVLVKYPGNNITGTFSVLYEVSNGLYSDTGIITVVINNPAAGAPRLALGTLETITDKSYANGTQLNRAKVKVVDAIGHAVINARVNWQAGSSVTLRSSTSVSDKNGYAFISATSITPKMSTLTAEVGGVRDQIDWQFTAEEVSLAFDSGIIVEKDKAVANNQDTNTVSVKVVNQHGHIVANTPVRWNGFTSLSILPNDETYTNVNGVATVSLSTPRVGSHLITATLRNGVTVSASTEFISNPDLIQIQAGSIRRDKAYDQVANNIETHQVSVKVVDEKNQPVSGVQVEWKAPNNISLNSKSPSTANGFATATFISRKAGLFNVQASLKGQAEIIDIHFIGDSATAVLKPGSLQVTRNYSKADGSKQNTAEIKLVDINGNPVPSQIIDWADNSGHSIFTPVASTTDDNGIARTAATSVVPFDAQLSATYKGDSLNAPWQFVSEIIVYDITLNRALTEGVAIEPIIDCKQCDTASATYRWVIDNNKSKLFGDKLEIDDSMVSDRVVIGKQLLLQSGEMGLPIELTVTLSSTDYTQTKKIVVNYEYLMVDEDQVYSAGRFWYLRRNDGVWAKFGGHMTSDLETNAPEIGSNNIKKVVWSGYGSGVFNDRFSSLLLLDNGTLTHSGPNGSGTNDTVPAWLDMTLLTSDIFTISGNNNDNHISSARQQRCFARRQQLDKSIDFWCTYSDAYNPVQGNSLQLVGEPITAVYGKEDHWLVFLASGKVGYLDKSGFHRKFNTAFDAVNNGFIYGYNVGDDQALSVFARKDNSLVIANPRYSTSSDIFQLNNIANQIKQVVFSRRAVALLTLSGTVQAMGDPSGGGDSSLVDSELHSISTLYATDMAFSALRSDGSVFSWGHKLWGGDNSTVATDLVGVRSLASSLSAFAAVNSLGKVVAWGNPDYGGDASANPDLNTHVKTILGISEGFIAVRYPEKAVVWGTSTLENDTSYRVLDNLRVLRPNSKINGKSAALITGDGKITFVGRDIYGGYDIHWVTKDLFIPKNTTTYFKVTDL